MDNDDRVLVADREAHRIQVFDGDGNVLDVWNNIHMPNGMTIGPDDNIYVGELPGATQADPTPPRHGHRVTIYDNSGKRLALLGADDEGEESGAFIAPHGMGVDSSGNIYVGEVSFTIRGSRFGPAEGTAEFYEVGEGVAGAALQGLSIIPNRHGGSV